MAKILCRTKGNANPKGKPRVYFTCHPEDVDRYFEKVCEDIFKTHDCAIFYTEDMTAVIEEQDKATDLESNNLFVVPVTFRLLSQPNRAMDADVPFAFEKHIPVLPFMMEPSIDEFYSRPDKFGELQYLNPYSTDLTEVSYEEKLKKYLESVLISDEMAKRIRAAFAAYIFLSYRKKDRRYANELMKLIHSHPECRDIAVWYDEFLTPGESFRENIEKVLGDSKLFTLLVTPNLLEEPDGKPNFVMGEEYPAAKKFGIDILPAEMEETDKDALTQKYEGIPQCIDPHDGEAFKLRLLEAVSKIATTANDDDPMHNYLIGLAYLDGIDVEVDRQRGLDLITSAAEADLPEAMEKLREMYLHGQHVQIDYKEAERWAKKLVAYYTKIHSEAHKKTIDALYSLAEIYVGLGDFEKAQTIMERVHSLRCTVLGEKHIDTIYTLHNLAMVLRNLGKTKESMLCLGKAFTMFCNTGETPNPNLIGWVCSFADTYMELDDYDTAETFLEQAYPLCLESLGAAHEYTLALLDCLVRVNLFSDLGKAHNFAEQAYSLACKIKGSEHPQTLTIMNNLATVYTRLGHYEKALMFRSQVYTSFCIVLGKEHPNTLCTLAALAQDYCGLKDYEKAIGIQEQIYPLFCTVFGVVHHNTFRLLRDMAASYFHLDLPQKSVDILAEAYPLSCEMLGYDHRSTLNMISILSAAYIDLNNLEEAIRYLEDAYPLFCRVFGKDAPDTITVQRNLSIAYRNLILQQENREKKVQECIRYCQELKQQVDSYLSVDNFPKALAKSNEIYTHYCVELGKDHPDTLKAQYDLAKIHLQLGEFHKALELTREAYSFQCEHLGATHSDTQASMKTLISLHKKTGDYKFALKLLKEYWLSALRTSKIYALFKKIH